MNSAARSKDVLRGTMDEASSLWLLCRSRLARPGRASDWAASFSDPIMGGPSGSSRREARTREEHHTGKRRRSRKALDLNRPNREEPKFRAHGQGVGSTEKLGNASHASIDPVANGALFGAVAKKRVARAVKKQQCFAISIGRRDQVSGVSSPLRSFLFALIIRQIVIALYRLTGG